MGIHCASDASDNLPPARETARLQTLPTSAMFTPPKDWRVADREALPPHVQIMVVGKGKSSYPPSLNLATEKFSGSLRDYLKIVKQINEAKKILWKDLGTVRTIAGNANLSQIETSTEWGQVKMMHAIIVKDRVAYILTAAALKDEFPDFYKNFFSSIQSLRINNDLYETINDQKLRSKFKNSNQNLENQFDRLLNENPSASPQQIFESDSFQNDIWKPYTTTLKKEYADMGEEWINLILATVQSILTQSNKD